MTGIASAPRRASLVRAKRADTNRERSAGRRACRSDAGNLPLDLGSKRRQVDEGVSQRDPADNAADVETNHEHYAP